MKATPRPASGLSGRFAHAMRRDGQLVGRDLLRPDWDDAAPTPRVPVPATLSGGDIDGGADPQAIEDGLFWQFPCRTEEAAFRRHDSRLGAPRIGDEVHAYVGLPWATWIDRDAKRQWRADARAGVEQRLWRLGVQVAGLRQALALQGQGLRVHTVCQHIGWKAMVPSWEALGITDAWLSHCPGERPRMHGPALRLHAWPLYAVNVEDPTRRAGLAVGRPVAERTLLASFAGAVLPNYVDDARQRIAALAGVPGFHVTLTGEWHFEDVVYRQQISGRHAPRADDADAIERFNRLLSDSVFSLCPAGAGRNTLRLWESLAVGSIPVLFGPTDFLPDEGVAADIDWPRIAIRLELDDIPDLPRRLGAVSAGERSERQRLALAAHRRLKDLRCFPS
jgi:hypothetical protein